MAQMRLTLRPQIFLVLIVILTALRPGDAGWVNDEPTLMEMAIAYNHTASHLYGISLPFTPSPFGLVGTHGERYGPAAVWLDQLFLVFTHNLIHMLAVRAVLCSALTAVALCWLAKTLRLSPWFAVITMLSPMIWLFSRQLWDNTLCIPLSALLLASYASFLAAAKPWTLISVIVCCFVLPTIHLMAIAMVLPVLLHLLLFHRDRIWAWRWKIGAALCFCLYLFWPYLYYSLENFHPAVPSENSPFRGWLFPLLGGHFLTLGVEGTMPCDGWQDHAPASLVSIVEHAQWISHVAIGVVWLGMALGAARAWAAIRRPGAANVTAHLCLVAMSVWICQTILDGLGRVYFAPHYYSATWIAYIFLAWIGTDWLRSRIRNVFFIPIVSVYAVSLLLGIGIIATRVALNAGTRNIFYGTCLRNQIAAIKKINNYSDNSKVDIEVPQWNQFPLAWKVIRQLYPPTSATRPQRNLVVKYRDSDPPDAHIMVEEVPGSL
jgi:hypothetical protein